MVKNLMSGSKRLLDFFGCLNYKRKFRQAHPEFFDPCGTLIFTGAQGEGKTLSAVQYIIKIAHEYPQSILVTNTWIDPKLFPEGYRIYEYTGLDDLKNYENGYAGVVFFIDEIHLELNSLESKNVDVDSFDMSALPALGEIHSFYLTVVDVIIALWLCGLAAVKLKSIMGG